MAQFVETSTHEDAVHSIVGPASRCDYVGERTINGVVVSAEFAQQATRMPEPVRQLLLDGVEPGVVSAEVLLNSLRLLECTHEQAKLGLQSPAHRAVLQRPGALSPEACAKLRDAVDNERRTLTDTVDGAPDHQRNLTCEGLEALIGKDAMAVLWKLPREFARETGGQLDEANVEIFVRRYTTDSRPWNPFHTDSAAYTVNMALVDDVSFQGGQLIACYGGAVRAIVRTEREATVHSSSLLHGVTMMTEGARYSLIMFFVQAKLQESSFTDQMRANDATALCTLMSDAGLLSRCEQTLGRTRLSTTQRNYEILRANADLGKTVEKVVEFYAAPHLRPVAMLERAWKHDATCWSLYNLLNYAVAGCGYVSQGNTDKT